jgi:hypothetical protein
MEMERLPSPRSARQYGIAREEIFNTLVSYPHLLGEREVVR